VTKLFGKVERCNSAGFFYGHGEGAGGTKPPRALPGPDLIIQDASST
jgi:hypothetical protein